MEESELTYNLTKMPSYLKEILKQDEKICLVFNKVANTFFFGKKYLI